MSSKLAQVPELNPSLFLQLQEEERQRLARALMQGPGQILANALMEVEYALPLFKKNPQVALAGMENLRDELRQGLAELKTYVADLQPPLLDEMGLGASVNRYVEHFGDRTGIAAECEGCSNFNARYPRTIEIALFRILQEALTNVQAHSRARRVHVELERHEHLIQLTVMDDGQGFSPITNAIAGKRQLGLVAMRDRAELLGGQLQLFSEPGQGVRLVVSIPYHGLATEPHTAQGGHTEYDRTNHNHTRARGKKQSGKKEAKPRRRTTLSR